jgi:hypothetical protein
VADPAAIWLRRGEGQRGPDKTKGFSTSLHLPGGRLAAPSPKTVARCLGLAGARALAGAVNRYLAAGIPAEAPAYPVSGPALQPQAACDGKMIRGALRGDGTPLFLLSAAAAGTVSAPAGAVVIADREIPSKTNEVPETAPMLRELNEYFPLAGHVLTADALRVQDDFAELARSEPGGHYVLTVKKNRRNLLAALDGLCWAGAARHVAKDKGHGRAETRSHLVMDAPEEIKALFPHVEQPAKVIRARTVRHWKGDGAFRDIRSWYLLTGRDGGPARSALRGAAPASMLRDPRELLDPSGRRLILVITDGVHPWWLPSGPLRPILAQWSKASPVAIMQPFPQRLWDRSAIRPALAEFRANGPGRFASRIIRPPQRLAIAVRTAPDVPNTVPILELTPLVLERWARLVSGSRPSATLAAAMLTGEPEGFRSPPLGRSANSLTAAELADPADLVRAFRASVSPSAYRLAGYLSVVAPLTLPVMRLVQESMLPEAGTAELAEVFLGGLLRRLPGYFAGSADRVAYGFAAGVRETLQSTVTSSEALTLLDQVGSYLVRGQRGGRPFSAVLASPVGGDVATASEQHPPFARVARKVLERIGGPFAEAAQQVTSGIAASDHESSTRGSSEAAQKYTRTGNSTDEHGSELRTLPGHPWSGRQVRIFDSWPTRRDQPVSLALSPAGDRLALSVGQQLSVADIANDSRTEHRLQIACALAPGLTWSPGGDKLAFRDDSGQGRLVDLSGPLSAPGLKTRMTVLGAASALAFVPDDDRLAILAQSVPGRMTLRLIRPNREVIWERTLTRKRISSYHLEGVNLVVSPDGSRLACTTGLSTVWVFDTVTGQQVCQFNDHSQIVTGLDWIDNESILSASIDATLRIWRPDVPVSSTVVETIAAAGMVFVRERRTALIWSASGELLAWSLARTPAQLWYRDPPRSATAPFTRLAVSAVDGLLALIDAGATELILVSDWHSAVNTPAVMTTYANAKILVLGDSGVGKSGLAMVLAGEEFRATESTSGRARGKGPTSTCCAPG